MSNFLDSYEPLDIIGNGSFGIIRKVRRKADGLIFARKELNFERMSERDRKQIVAEVNILKDLHHEHIVRYHDRHVDRDAGILYILMEYCGGGDLSAVIRHAQKTGRPIHEDTIWNYFMQILLALQHCHHPNGSSPVLGHGRTSNSAGEAAIGIDGEGGKERRAQILHRDLKPDNVFLDEANQIKLGDFGLSKALPHASFANTYVGTPYYMSPELLQEKSYDSKSDIWSLGCLIYELCALKPPFHEAKTHSELNALVRNGRIPPLPKGYSQQLTSVIKAMLNLNPAMRPSAAQLLQHEQLKLALKVSEAEKMLNTVKHHKSALAAKERDLLSREAMFAERESALVAATTQKDTEICSLNNRIAQLESQISNAQSQFNALLANRIHAREEELKILVLRREEEVSQAMQRREEEIMNAVREREERLCAAVAEKEGEMQSFEQELLQRESEINSRIEELEQEEQRLNAIREELDERVARWEKESKGKKEKTPLEEVKNLLARVSDDAPTLLVPTAPSVAFKTPVPRVRERAPPMQYPVSAMKGVVFTSTGQVLQTPTAAELANLFVETPRVGLNFAKIFDRDRGVSSTSDLESESEDESLPPSPSKRARTKTRSGSASTTSSNSNSTSSGSSGEATPRVSRTLKSAGQAQLAPTVGAPTQDRPTRLRRPSIRNGSSAPQSSSQSSRSKALPASTSDPAIPITSAPSTVKKASSNPSTSNKTSRPITNRASTAPATEWDLADEENLPSPFLKRVERERLNATVVANAKKRASIGGHSALLRAVTTRNAAGKSKEKDKGKEEERETKGVATRSAVAAARKAAEEARKALSRS